MRDSSTPEIGRRYREAKTTAFGAPSRTAWIVANVARWSDGLLYVKLVREDDKSQTKTISLVTLKNQRLYLPIATRNT